MCVASTSLVYDPVSLLTHFILCVALMYHPSLVLSVRVQSLCPDFACLAVVDHVAVTHIFLVGAAGVVSVGLLLPVIAFQYSLSPLLHNYCSVPPPPPTTRTHKQAILFVYPSP